MNLEAERRLKFDRRLEGRRTVVSEAEIDAELEALPDSSAKIQPPEEDGAGARGAAAPEARAEPGTGY
jgi:hypothetical protein